MHTDYREPKSRYGNPKARYNMNVKVKISLRINGKHLTNNGCWENHWNIIRLFWFNQVDIFYSSASNALTLALMVKSGQEQNLFFISYFFTKNKSRK